MKIFHDRARNVVITTRSSVVVFARSFDSVDNGQMTNAKRDVQEWRIFVTFCHGDSKQRRRRRQQDEDDAQSAPLRPRSIANLPRVEYIVRLRCTSNHFNLFVAMTATRKPGERICSGACVVTRIYLRWGRSVSEISITRVENDVYFSKYNGTNVCNDTWLHFKFRYYKYSCAKLTILIYSPFPR